MTLVKLTIRVDNINTLLEDFTHIRVFKSDSEFGTYTEISTLGTRPRLCSNCNYYIFRDKVGSEYAWYKWRYYNTSTAAESPYSRPVQGSQTNSRYVMLEDVKRILMTGEQRIKFSDGYKNIKPSNGNNASSTIKLSNVSFHPDYAGIEQFSIVFSDPTNYEVTVTEQEIIEPRSMGTGTTGADFTSDNDYLYIPSTAWSGTAFADDEITFLSDSNMSTTNAMLFIRDTEKFVDAILEASLQYIEAKDYEHRYALGVIPKAIEFATSRLAAFFIYTTVYNEQQIPGLPASINDITVGLRRNDDISTWPKQAMKVLEMFIWKYQNIFDPNTGNDVTTAPTWWHTDSLFDASGVAYVGEGLKLPDVDEFKTQSELSYAGLLDWDLMFQGITALTRVSVY